jgi:hypothetical protein
MASAYACFTAHYAELRRSTECLKTQIVFLCCLYHLDFVIAFLEISRIDTGEMPTPEIK